MRIDLHTHSAVSDGTDSPAELVRAAAAAGLDVVALTDHDTAAGWPEARAAAAEAGIEVVPGMEISTKHRGQGVHLLAYLVDPEHPDLARRLARIVDGRGDRIPEMLERLAAAGVPIAPDELQTPGGPGGSGASGASGGDGPVGRPHVADALVRRGYVADRTEAFDRYLSKGRPAYVDRYAPELGDTIAAVVAAGGVPVIAHAWGRHGRAGLPAADVAALQEVGLAGLEVDHHDHDAAARRDLRALAEGLGLVVTGSSDYHGTGKVDHDLGSETTDPRQFEALLARAGRPA